MIIDYLKSLFENIKERVKNPFLEKNNTPFAGAFIIAAVVYNWKLVYSLFNFDDTDNREKKIQIISEYLNSVSICERLGYPLLIAFGSIVFYYVFNNVSLGITTFFNRWFRASILYVTDRSKIITRAELEKTISKMNTTRTRFEELRRTFAESQSELEELKNQIRQQEVEFARLNSDSTAQKGELEVKIKQLEESNKRLNEFKILYAQYGKNGSYKDVTQNVIDGFLRGRFLDVNNESLGGDPIVGVVKELLLLFQSKQTVRTLIVQEDEVVSVSGDELVISDTTESLRKKELNEAGYKVNNIINGSWELTYSKDSIVDKEKLTIDNDNKYYIRGSHAFNLKNAKSFEKTIRFDKIRLDGTLHAAEDLKFIEPGLIRGKDSLGYTLEYKKVIS